MAITLVQAVVSNTGHTVSLGSPTTAGNCVVVGYGSTNGATSTTACTLGGAAGNFAKAAELFDGSTALASIWVDPNCAGGQTAIAITAPSGAFDTIWAAEFSGIVLTSPVDKTSTNDGSASSWSSGSTATTTQAVELWVGAFNNTSSTSPTGPAGWTNTNVNNVADYLYGYDIVSTTGAAAYSGTSGTSEWVALVVTLKGAAAPGGAVLPYTGGQVYQSQRRKRSQLALTPPPPVTTSGGFALGALAFTATGNVVPPTPLLPYIGGQVSRQQRNKRRQQVLPSGLPSSSFGLAGLGFSGTVNVSPTATGGFKLAGLGFSGQVYEITSTGGFKLAGLSWAGNVAKETEPDSGGFGLGAIAFGGSALVDFPFPKFILGLKYEVLINGTWTDITGFVYQRDVTTITRGLPDETQTATPSQMTVTLNNRDGRFSPKNPSGAYYPYLTRNVQLRVSVTNQVASSTGVTYTGYRFWGEVSSWPPRWDPSQSDIYCQITVSGVLRRYVQGAKMGSTLRQYYTNLTGSFAPYAVWPAEDGSSATEISSALPSVASMSFTGTPGFSSNSAFGGSDALPTISSSEWHGTTGAAADPPGTGSITETFPGTYTWICPNGVTAVTGVVCQGSGGGGGDQDTSAGGGGGGGGGTGKSSSIGVTAGVEYTYVVPPGGAAGSASNGSAGANATWTGDSSTCTGYGGAGGVLGGAGGTGGAGSTYDGGNGASGSTSTGSYQNQSLNGSSGGSGGGADGGQTSTDWTAPDNITGDIYVESQGGGGGGAGGGSGDEGAGGGGGGGGGLSSGTTSASAGESLTFYAGNGGAGGSAAHGGTGGTSGVSDGTAAAGGGTGGSGSDVPGSGGSGNESGGSGGGFGGPHSGGTYGGGGGGGGPAGAGPGGSSDSRAPGAGGPDGGGGGGWGASGGSGSTAGGTGSNGGGGGGGGATGLNAGQVGGGGGGGYIQWTWEIAGAPSGGGGGSSAGTSGAGNAGSTAGTGGSAPTGGGAGGTTGSTPAGQGPGGGGAGGVPDSGSGATSPGSGAAGQVAFSWDGGVTSPVAGDIVRFCLEIDSAGSEDGAVLLRAVTYGTIATLDVIYNTASGGELTLKGYTGGTTYFTSTAITGINGIPLYVDVELNASGANAVYTFAVIEPGAGSAYATETGTVDTISIGYVSDIYVDPAGAVTDSGTTLGWVTAQTYADTLVNLSPIVNGYAGELAADRISRLCTQQGIGFTLVGTDTDTPQMGPQQDDTFVNVIQSCCDLDRGQLFETRDQLGIGYRTRVNMQGQSPAFLADYSLATLAGSLEPVEDDQLSRNDITVTRNGGASSTATLTSGPMSTMIPPNGIGDYTYALTVQAYADSQLANLVAWMLTVGTVDEYRYPTVTFDLTRSEVAGLFAAIPTLDVGDYVQVINPPSFVQSAPISQLCWGFTETLNAYVWTISINTVPESPYSEGDPPTW